MSTWMVNLTLRPLYFRRKSPQYPLNRRGWTLWIRDKSVAPVMETLQASHTPTDLFMFQTWISSNQNLIRSTTVSAKSNYEVTLNQKFFWIRNLQICARAHTRARTHTHTHTHTTCRTYRAFALCISNSRGKDPNNNTTENVTKKLHHMPTELTVSSLQQIKYSPQNAWTVCPYFSRPVIFWVRKVLI
jgi:hypothetical protein